MKRADQTAGSPFSVRRSRRLVPASGNETRIFLARQPVRRSPNGMLSMRCHCTRRSSARLSPFARAVCASSLPQICSAASCLSANDDSPLSFPLASPFSPSTGLSPISHVRRCLAARRDTRLPRLSLGSIVAGGFENSLLRVSLAPTRFRLLLARVLVDPVEYGFLITESGKYLRWSL